MCYIIVWTNFSSTSSLASPSLPRKPTMYPSASSASYSTLPRMSSRISTASTYADTQPPIVRITTRSYSNDASYATLPRMSSRDGARICRQPTRGDVATSPVTLTPTSTSVSSSQRFAQAIASPDSGYYGGGVGYGGRTSPMVMSTFTPSRHYASPGN